MKLGAAFRILVVALLCALGLVGLVVREGLARASGTEVVLRTGAVDPRSLLSGHYVVLAFQEPRPPGAVCPPGTEGRSGDGWVALRADGDHHSVAGMAASRDEALELAPVAVRGQARCVSGAVIMRIGIDRFHINQADAERIEGVLREQRPSEDARVWAIVSAGDDGKARLKGLVVDGERIELSWL